MLFALCALLLSLPACEESRQPPRTKWNDVSYANHRGHVCGPNALDVPVALEDFEGSFLWVDYAAPWCAPCRRQAAVIRSMDLFNEGTVVFLTLITSGNEPMEDATRAIAATWAERYRLDPSRVVASREMSRTIPQHTLFSPQGQTLYHAIGYHSEAQIRAVIARHVDEWRRQQPEVSAAN
jgi:hypothetical protein